MQVNAAGVTNAHTIVGFVFLNKTDFVELRVFQSSGGALLTGAGTGFFYGVWVHS